VRAAQIDLKPLLSRADIAVGEVDDPETRIAVRKQVAFLNLAADALGDDCLGLTLATEFDCRDFGLWYYVLASSETLGMALERAGRYSRIGNEAVVFDYHKGREPSQRLSYIGIPRHAARHQMEFGIVAAVRMYRFLTGRQLSPTHVSMVHLREKGAAAFARILGTEVAFGSEVDEIVFPPGAPELPLVNADPRLNKILVEVQRGRSERTKARCGHQCRPCPRVGRERRHIAPASWRGARGYGRQKARDERANAGAKACRGRRDVHRDRAAAQGYPGTVLSRGHEDAGFQGRLALGLRGAKLL